LTCQHSGEPKFPFATIQLQLIELAQRLAGSGRRSDSCEASNKESIMSTEKTVSTLNSLIQVTLDSMKGYQDAAKDAESTQFATMFAEFARDRSAAATELQAEVRRLGGDPESDSSFLAAAHRTFMDLKQAITGKDDKAIIQEVERGEDHIKAKMPWGTPILIRRRVRSSSALFIPCVKGTIR
jgi:uncharacterized protein (TIGR02284 family)